MEGAAESGGDGPRLASRGYKPFMGGSCPATAGRCQASALQSGRYELLYRAFARYGVSASLRLAGVRGRC